MSNDHRRYREALIVEIAAGGLVVAFNLAANRLPQRVQLPTNLAAAGLATLLARGAGVAWEDQGLHPRHMPRGALTGFAVAAALGTITAAGLLAPGARRFYQDEWIVSSSTTQALYHVFVRIPLATALPEELIFRGSLLGLLARRRSPVLAAAISSLLFGLWHVVPTFDRIQSNPATRHAHGDLQKTVAVIAGHVMSTTLMGLGLSWLRFRSQSILAPILAHAAPNAVGFLGGWSIAHTPHIRRRLRRAVSRSAESGSAAPAPAPAVKSVESANGPDR
jgi:membrane protease YdiL (CAAX protease family)